MTDNLRDWVGYERTLHKLPFDQLITECRSHHYLPKTMLIKGLLKHLGCDDRYLQNPLLTHVDLNALGEALDSPNLAANLEIIVIAATNWYEQEIQNLLIQRIEHHPSRGGPPPRGAA